TVPGRRIHVSGVVTPFRANQVVLVRAYIGRRLIWLGHRKLKPSRRGTYGTFAADLASPLVGDVTVKVNHARNQKMARFVAHRKFSALDENIHFGSTGRFVELMQQRLAALHFYIPQTGVYDSFMG